jgi:hypothetical protein
LIPRQVGLSHQEYLPLSDWIDGIKMLKNSKILYVDCCPGIHFKIAAAAGPRKDGDGETARKLEIIPVNYEI